MMSSHEVYQTVNEHKVVAIMRGASPQDVSSIVQSLEDGGIKMIEVTLNSPGALKSIEQLKSEFPHLIIGAGTVLDSESARLSILSGADFILTPTLKESTIKMANRYDKPIIPGVLSPTEVLLAYEMGVKTVKVFPAGSFPANFISNLKGPLQHIDVMAVGGITKRNAKKYLDAGASSLGIGSDIVNNDLVEAKNFKAIQERAKNFVDIVKHQKNREQKCGVYYENDFN